MRYLALGTRNVYWSPSIGYSVQSLSQQPELTPVIESPDVVIFRYQPSGSSPMRRWTGAGALLAVAAGAAGVAIGSGDQVPESYGYLLFTPTDVAEAPTAMRTDGVRIDSCRDTPKGLEVRGHAVLGPAPVQIGVTPADPTGAGLRIGVALAAHVPLWAGAVPGDFQVVIPWATTQSQFAALTAQDLPSSGPSGPQSAESESSASTESESATGAMATCPPAPR